MEHDAHQADAVFALPSIPRQAAVLGGLDAWSGGLETRGLEVVAARPRLPLVVAAEHELDRALELEPDAVLVDGSRRAGDELARTGLAVRRLLPLPLHGSPVVYADLAHADAVRFAFQRGLAHAQRWRTVRNRLVGALAGRGLAPPFPRLVAAGLRADGQPALLAEARQLGVSAAGGWVMLVAYGPVVRRNAFLAFPRGSARPETAIRFSRVRSQDEPYERERAAREAVASLPAVDARAPRRLGALDVDGRRAVVETAATGATLLATLRGSLLGRRALARLDDVAGWLVEVARASALEPQALAPLLARLEADLASSKLGAGVGGGLAARLRDVPATFQHNDLGPDNVVVADGGFTVLDWEWAERAGLPLGDLLYFAARTLALADGADIGVEEEQERHFGSLFAGDAPSSERLFRWVRELVRALSIPTEQVGSLATASWLRRALVSEEQRLRAERAVGRELGPDFQVRVARRWLAEPALGERWRAWLR